MAVNVYASSIAKTVFVWICLLLLIITWYYSILGVKIITNQGSLTNIPFIGKYLSDAVDDSIKKIPQVGPIVYVVFQVFKYGGMVAFASTMGLLCIIETFWRPQRNIKKHDKEVSELAKQAYCKQ